MGRVCKWVVLIYQTLWGLAVILLIVGTFGLFGQEEDPLSGVFLVPLGLPWVLWIDGLPETLRLITAVFAPLINVAILSVLCRALWPGKNQEKES